MDDKREEIIQAYYSMESLADQPQWICCHVTSAELNGEKRSRKSESMEYFLPIAEADRDRVCRVMFLNTTGVAERQVRTALAETTPTRVMQPEKLGGEHAAAGHRNAELSRRVQAHINRFPRIESHYCRSDTSNQYLSKELSVKRVHGLHNTEFWSIEFRGHFIIAYSCK